MGEKGGQEAGWSAGASPKKKKKKKKAAAVLGEASTWSRAEFKEKSFDFFLGFIYTQPLSRKVF